MKKLILAALGFFLLPMGQAHAEDHDMSHFTHLVFFKLKNNDEASQQALIDGAKKYLAPHDGIVYFAVGPRATDKQRDVNDQAFDIALTVVFESEEAQDAYQVTDEHLAFIDELNDNWAEVRVFDAHAAD